MLLSAQLRQKNITANNQYASFVLFVIGGLHVDLPGCTSSTIHIEQQQIRIQMQFLPRYERYQRWCSTHVMTSSAMRLKKLGLWVFVYHSHKNKHKTNTPKIFVPCAAFQRIFIRLQAQTAVDAARWRTQLTNHCYFDYGEESQITSIWTLCWDQNDTIG